MSIVREKKIIKKEIIVLSNSVLCRKTMKILFFERNHLEVSDCLFKEDVEIDNTYANTIGDIIDFIIIDKNYLPEKILLEENNKSFSFIAFERDHLLENINNGILVDFIKFLNSKNKEIKAAMKIKDSVKRRRIKPNYKIDIII